MSNVVSTFVRCFLSCLVSLASQCIIHTCTIPLMIDFLEKTLRSMVFAVDWHAYDGDVTVMDTITRFVTEVTKRGPAVTYVSSKFLVYHHHGGPDEK